MIFPTDSGIQGLVYWMIQGIMSWGWLSYGFAIVFFTLFIKLMLAPVDFLNRYLSRKNQIQTQALSKELADLQKIYGNDPIAFTRARQDLYRKNGVGGAGSSLMVLVSLILTLVIFINVMNALNQISKVNIYREYEDLRAEYQSCVADGVDETTMHDRLNAKYHEDKTGTSFFWVKNIWQPDNFWSGAVMTFEEFNNSQPKDKKLPEEEKATYEAITAQLDGQYKGSNGCLVLVVLVALTSFISMKLSTKLNERNMPKKEATAKAEPIITYSMRDAKAQGAEAAPEIDPAQVGRIMQYIMPIILIFFTVNQTAAFAIYMIASSLVATALNTAFSFIIDAIIKRHPPKGAAQPDFDATIINPHAKYFKGGKK